MWSQRQGHFKHTFGWYDLSYHNIITLRIVFLAQICRTWKYGTVVYHYKDVNYLEKHKTNLKIDTPCIFNARSCGRGKGCHLGQKALMSYLGLSSGQFFSAVLHMIPPFLWYGNTAMRYIAMHINDVLHAHRLNIFSKDFKTWSGFLVLLISSSYIW